MKVQTSIRTHFDNQKLVNAQLKEHVDNLFTNVKHRRWHYESRLKELESFAVKVETGRVKDPAYLEDYLACTLVVPTTAELQSAIELVQEYFTIGEKRPADLAVTRKNANSFPFDDLRLYCRRDNDGTRPADLSDNVLFEIQIKTFLQHAWGIATHDLSYKTDDVRWGKDRLVAHLKASIEYAELAIQETSTLSRSGALSLQHQPTTMIAEVIEILQKHWSRADLPANLRSLAETLRDIIAGLKLSTADLDDLLRERALVSGGQLSLNLSPYATIIEALVFKHEDKIVEYLETARNKIVITPEMTLPDGFPPKKVKSKIVLIK